MTDRDSIVTVMGSGRRRARSPGFAPMVRPAISISLGFLALMVGSIALRGAGAFQQTFVQLEISLPAGKLDPQGTRDPALLKKARYGTLLKEGLRGPFP